MLSYEVKYLGTPISNKLNLKSLPENIISQTIKWPFKKSVYDTNEINEVDIYPRTQLSYKGSTVFITCYSRVKPKWTKNGWPLPEEGKILKFVDVSEERSGIYTCKGTSANSTSKKFIANSELLVGGIALLDLTSEF